MKKRNLKIAITGPPAAGKSTVLKIFEEMGYPVFSADKVVHHLSRPCQKGYHLVIKELGNAFLKENKEIDRRKLLKAMLVDYKVKKTLEDIFHPLVKEELLKWIKKEKNSDILAAEIPLLYQAGWENFFDQIIFVTCGEEILLKRLIDRLKDKNLAQKLIKSYQVQPRKTDFIIKTEADIDMIKNMLLDFIKNRKPRNFV